jgi:beta-glucosidase
MADLAFGKATPSGKLAETFPLKKEDVPCDRYFPGGNQASYYQESLYIGYRYYETVGKEVLFPFGFGLSYAKFTYSQAELKGRSLSFYITNNGDCEGKETYFVFAKKPDGRLFTPAKELIAFGKVSLASGEKKLISLEITDQMLASYDPDDKKWEVENGEAVIFVASSAKDVKASFVLPLNGEKHLNPARKVPTAYENGRIENLSQADFASLLGRSPLPLNAVDPLKDLGEDLSFKAIADSNQAVQALLGRLAQDSNPTIAELLSMVPVRQYCLMLPEPVKIPFHEAFFQLCRGEKVKENSMVILKILQMLSSGGRKTDL